MKNLKFYLIKRYMYLCTIVLISLDFMACEKESVEFMENAHHLTLKKNHSSGPFEFPVPVYDIASTPDGGILVGVNAG